MNRVATTSLAMFAALAVSSPSQGQSWVLEPNNKAIPPGQNDEKPCKARVTGRVECYGWAYKYAATGFVQYAWDSFGNLPAHLTDVLEIADPLLAQATGNASVNAYGCKANANADALAQLSQTPNGVVNTWGGLAKALAHSDSTKGPLPAEHFGNGAGSATGQEITSLPYGPPTNPTQAPQPGATQGVIAKTYFKVTAPAAWNAAQIAAYAGTGLCAVGYGWNTTKGTAILSGPGFLSAMPPAGTANAASNYNSIMGLGMTNTFTLWTKQAGAWNQQFLQQKGDSFAATLDSMSIGTEAAFFAYADVTTKSIDGAPARSDASSNCNWLLTNPR